MALPFLLIGKALKSLSKVSKGAWKAMGKTFANIKSGVEPTKAYAKITEILGIVMLPVVYLFTILASIIIKYIIPYVGYIIKAIQWFGRLFDAIGGVSGAIEFFTYNSFDMIKQIWELIDATIGWDNILKALGDTFYGIDGTSSGLNISLIDLDDSLIDVESSTGNLELKMFDLQDAIDAIQIPDWGGGFGGGGGGGFPGVPGLPGVEPPSIPGLPGLSAVGATNNFNFDFRGSIIDNRDKLIRDIAEQVSMRIW